MTGTNSVIPDDVASNQPPTTAEPVQSGLRDLLECLQDWLKANRGDNNAYRLTAALASETLKRVDSADPCQREFDAQALAAAADGPVDFEAAKRWIDRAKLDSFHEARRSALEEHFRAAGHVRALRVARRSTKGKHRAMWSLEPYPLDEALAEPAVAELPDEARESELQRQVIQYEVTPHTVIRAAWYARPLLGAGSFVTRSWRGLLWMAVFLVPVAYLLITAGALLGYRYAERPLQTSDLASMLLLIALAWVVWRLALAPLIHLVDDRIIPTAELWVAWNEEPAQLELVTDPGNRRRLQLVRYSAVCPVCAGKIELRYSQGPNRRRLVGCCNEAPHDHVFSFDRVSRRGQRVLTDGW